MNLIMIDKGELEGLKRMFAESCETVKTLAKQVQDLNLNLLTAKQVADITNLTPATILRKKEEIGFVAFGNDIRFEREALEAYIKNNRISPKQQYKN